MQTMAGILWCILGVISLKWAFDTTSEEAVWGIIFGLIGIVVGFVLFVNGLLPVINLIK